MLKPDAAFRKDRRCPDLTTLQHRHYAAIADIVRDLQGPTRKRVAQHFADRLSINPRFDRARFLAACDA